MELWNGEGRFNASKRNKIIKEDESSRPTERQKLTKKCPFTKRIFQTRLAD